MKAKACAKVADAHANEGEDAGEQREGPDASEILTRLKRRVRELDQLEPKDGRLATRERYEILATVRCHHLIGLVHVQLGEVNLEQ